MNWDKIKAELDQQALAEKNLQEKHNNLQQRLIESNAQLATAHQEVQDARQKCRYAETTLAMIQDELNRKTKILTEEKDHLNAKICQNESEIHQLNNIIEESLSESQKRLAEWSTEKARLDNQLQLELVKRQKIENNLNRVQCELNQCHQKWTKKLL